MIYAVVYDLGLDDDFVLKIGSLKVVLLALSALLMITVFMVFMFMCYDIYDVSVML